MIVNRSNPFQALVVLEGYQAILKPSKFGYSLEALLNAATWKETLEANRMVCLEWCEKHIKNPKGKCLKSEPWEETEEGKLKIKFSWNEEHKPALMDTDCLPITKTDLPLLAGCKVMIAFYQKPYLLRDNKTYGTSLKLLGIQVVDIPAPVNDVNDVSFDDIAKLFGKRDGFKQSSY